MLMQEATPEMVERWKEVWLDEKDIQNYFCVAEYISCLKKFGLLESVLG